MIIRALQDRRQAPLKGTSSYDRRKAQRRGTPNDTIPFTVVDVSEYKKISAEYQILPPLPSRKGLQ